ncbi:DUF2515 family protein [Siminovitchia sediminis]|uniref:DUF2515 family protein n=1 Tax=Siminovitchia sediminis TaxID=1274353 RepID=A0ABW4KI15_9BACI
MRMAGTFFRQANDSRCKADMIIKHIRQRVFKHNKDNISRTKFYQRFFISHPEIAWSFLASMVSRNTGWNMTDLHGDIVAALLNERTKKQLFLSLERANWIIFKDACPQLLIYHFSKLLQQPLFHLLDDFAVSSFMKREWNEFWDTGDRRRLLYALIVNEQHMIQEPVLSHPFYKRKIFHSAFFTIQERLRFNCVIFPSVHGELYGESVRDFNKTWKRIDLGKRLAGILFHEDLYPHFLSFALKTEPTGSRWDYEQYSSRNTYCKSPMLRAVFPVIEHHARKAGDWSLVKSIKPDWLDEPCINRPVTLTDWFYKKQEQLELYSYVRKSLTKD